MPTTPIAALPYPALNEPPNVPLDMGELALATDGQLYRAFQCTSTTRPTLTAGDRGFLADESDTGNVSRWSGTAWVTIGGGGGGGGGGAVLGIDGQWIPSNAQSISTADTVVAFGTQEIGSSVVTRSASGAGHKFALTEDGTYFLGATCRFAAGLAGRRFAEFRNAAQTARHVSEGFTVDDGDTATVNLSTVKRFSAGAEIVLIATQSGQGSLVLQHEGVSIVPGFVRLNITKVAG